MGSRPVRDAFVRADPNVPERIRGEIANPMSVQTNVAGKNFGFQFREIDPPDIAVARVVPQISAMIVAIRIARGAAGGPDPGPLSRTFDRFLAQQQIAAYSREQD